jgi:predicted methyltransferase
MKTLIPALLLGTALMIAACGKGPAPAPTLTELLASDSRSAEDRARDAGRRPADVIAATGIDPGMSVLDVIAASGWYTEVLSIAVGPSGHVTAHNTAFTLQMRDGANDIAMTARLADDRLPNVSRLAKETHEISAEDGPFDAALTALNLHDIYGRGGDAGAAAVMAAVYSALKPGGFFVVIDHEGVAGNDNVALHRMQKSDAIRAAETAGFVVDLDSNILYNPADDMSLHMRDESVSGKTNRFLLRFRKPQ